MANRKQQPGIIGLGSRLFVAKESTWGTAITTTGSGANTFEGYNLYPQPGGRPQKTTTPIEVTQLFPSAIRRKPLQGVSSVEGSFTFALPKENNDIFWQMITGTATGTGNTVSNGVGGEVLALSAGTADALDTAIQSTQNNFGDLTAGTNVTISGVITDYPGADNAISAMDFADGSAVAGADLVGSVHLKITLTSTPNALLAVGDQILLTCDVDDGTAFSSEATACLASNVTVGAFSGQDIYLKTGSTDLGAGSLTNATDINLVFDDVGTASNTLRTGGFDDAEIASFNAIHNINYTSGGPSQFEIDFPIATINSIAHINIAGMVVGLPGSTYGLSSDVSDSYTFVNSIGATRIAQYSGMTPSSLTLSVTADSTISTEITFLGKDEVIKDVSAENVTSFLNPNPFTITDGRIVKITNPITSGFDNFNDVYPSWSATLKIVKKEGGENGTFNEGVSNYQYWNESVPAWADLSPVIATAMADAKAIVPFSDFTLTIENSIEFSTYVNGEQARTKPIQTSFREVTVGITIPYNVYTSPLIDSMFNNDSFACELLIKDGAKEVKILLREICITGDGGLGDIPEGEITTSLTFTAYAPHENINSFQSFDPATYSPVEITVD